MRPSVYIGLLTQRQSIRILRDSLVRTQIIGTMSGWNDGGRGEKGNRRMFDPAEVSEGNEDVLGMGRAFNSTRTQQEEGDKSLLERCGREIQTSVLSCLTS